MAAVTLPPGQHAIDGFPRFGTHLHHPPPPVPREPTIEIGGAVTNGFSISLEELAAFPRRKLTADFHCVAGWSASGLEWEGVAFQVFYRQVIEPALEPDAVVTHIVFSGLDGFQAVVLTEDALADDVLIAEYLDGRPLDSDHGAPLRLLSPGQYGYMSTKHLCRIDVHTSEPEGTPGTATRLGDVVLRGRLITRHPRARVWEEERHPYLPLRAVRPIYRALIPPFRFLAARGSRESGEAD